jgi:hypothetical protein
MTNSIQPVDGVLVALVMPCLNEAQNLEATCASLGFGSGTRASPEGTVLIIIDNGSSDSTLSIAEQITRSSKPDAVLVGQELERGHVPVRHRGNLIAGELARSEGLAPETVLILQVDADCHYSAGYIASMRAAIRNCEPNVMIEACVDYPAAFKAEYPEYIQMCSETDAEFDKLFPSDLSHDNLVVDAVSGYRLSDYFKWGGHRRELNAQREEILAETSRLFMRARAQGALRHRADSGLALHSPRKVLRDPTLHLATAGFPREASWNRNWQDSYHGPSSLRDLCAQPNHPEVLKAIRVREEHLLALFGVLPLHVDRALAQLAEGGPETKELAFHILPLLPVRTIRDLTLRPGILIADVFELISNHGAKLLNQACKVIAERHIDG